ncbi:DUF1120 domain-containing protein [Paraburkholderia sartisoli]|uniref:DUF1120 domain-containing protein n=1 Tax=Paraburkholderia sartisoli TaxID=83784 RepID=A0A1H4G3U3_9BURK|nr:DUF1120 domain-containing protein [Paraburkholderia sartisoli]SEB04273.1 Protein of unknown function [Paraburkholderia sartisoli]
MKLVSKNTLLAALLAATSVGAFAADTVDLKIIGTIVPPSCTPTISGGGVADFGRIPVASLSDTAGTLLTARTASLTVTCDAPARVGLTTLDNRAGTLGVSAKTVLLGADDQRLGVGLVGGKTVGAYNVKILKDGIIADGNAADGIYSQNGGATWAPQIHPYGDIIQPGIRTHGWANAGQTVPAAFSTITQPIEVDLALNAKSDMPSLNQEVPIDGLATFSLVYL